jgi:hypothetical protein
MSKLINLLGVAVTVAASTAAIAVASPASAASGFQNTCSNISFGYNAASAATLNAMCLRADGSANGSSLVLTGIANQNGKLVQGSGASSFQKSCGNIQITANAGGATLSALCRGPGGSSSATSLPLNNVGNNNGNLSY